MSIFPIVSPSSIKVALGVGFVYAFAVSPFDAEASLKVDNDGNVYRRINFGAWTQIYPATDWVRPVSAAPGLYEVRYTNLTGAALDSATKAEGVWHSLSAGDFILRQERSGFGIEQSDFTVQIRHDGGPVLASAAYTLRADVEV